MGYKLILSPLALEDLGQIVAYIAQNDPAAAERLGHRLLDQAETLRYLPHRGGNVRQPRVNKLISGAYLIFIASMNRLDAWRSCGFGTRRAQDPDRLQLR